MSCRAWDDVGACALGGSSALSVHDGHFRHYGVRDMALL